MLSSIKTKVIIFSTLLTLVVIGFQYIPQQISNEKLVAHSQKNLKNIGEIVYKTVVNNQNANKSNAELKENLRKDFYKIKVGKEGFPFIIDTEGTYILHPKVENKNWKNKKFIQQMIKEKSGFIEYISPKTGQAKYVSFKYCESRDWIIAVSMWANEFEEITAFATSMMYYSIIAAVIILSLFFIYILKSIISPLICFHKRTTKIAQGNYKLTFNIKRNDEIGKLSTSLNTMVQNMVYKITTEEKATLELKSAMEAISMGDLTVSVNEFDKEGNQKILFSSFNKSVAKISAMFGKLSETILTTASLTKEISNNTVGMASNANEENNQINTVASAVEEIAQTIRQTSDNANCASESAKKVEKDVHVGTQKVEDSIHGMERIVDSSEKIGDILSSLTSKIDQVGNVASIINDIADQTNLLALNAAIEAARAGEQGRGFAVVADEVRKLAERTSTATLEIAKTISTVQAEAHEANKAMGNTRTTVVEGMQLSDEVNNALNSILQNVDEVTSQINNVAAASEQETVASGLISQNLTAINNLSSDNTNLINGIAASSELLSNLSEDLEKLVNEFKVNIQKDSEFTEPYRQEEMLVV
ncbi:MAG: methyl-accepting chemotaxis protein [Melioribacteraceae bacterium]